MECVNAAARRGHRGAGVGIVPALPVAHRSPGSGINVHADAPAAAEPAIRVSVHVVGNRDVAGGVGIEPTVAAAWRAPTPVSLGYFEFVPSGDHVERNLPNTAAWAGLGHQIAGSVPPVEITRHIVWRGGSQGRQVERGQHHDRENNNPARRFCFHSFTFHCCFRVLFRLIT